MAEGVTVRISNMDGQTITQTTKGKTIAVSASYSDVNPISALRFF